MIRKVASGVPMTAAIDFFACPGKAAKIRPSMTKTSPIAARKSMIPGGYRAGAAAPVGAADDALGPFAEEPGGAAGVGDSLPDGLLK